MLSCKRGTRVSLACSLVPGGHEALLADPPPDGGTLTHVEEAREANEEREIGGREEAREDVHPYFGDLEGG
jgi:hypothetical protein